MALRIYLVDDEEPARRRMTMLLSDIAAECPHQVVGEAGDAAAALQGIAALRPDVVLLDVQMPGMSGLALAAALRKNAGKDSNAPALIFTTAFDAYAIQAFDVQAVDYLLKPVRAARLAEALRRVPAAVDRTAASPSAAAAVPTRRHFSVHERGRLLMVPVDEVLYLKAEQKYVTLRAADREYLIEEPLVSIEEELATLFIRVHRNALVARTAIVGVQRGPAGGGIAGDGEKGGESWEVLLRGVDERLPISRRQWPAIKALVK